MGNLAHALLENVAVDDRRNAPISTPNVLPVSVIVPVKNEAGNLARCLESLRCAGEVYVIDSSSTDGTAEIAHTFGAKVVQFDYPGGWPKKRQWAMDVLPLKHGWVLLLDADEALTPELEDEIRKAITHSGIDGYYISLDMVFLGRRLRHCGARFYKLALFRHGRGRFECRTQDQDISMCDMEVHEHVIVTGRTSTLKYRLLHHNVASLSCYIQKHDQYSNWEARVWSVQSGEDQLRPSLFASQAQRRRWLKNKFMRLPGSPVALFLYRYLARLGFLDGIPGLIYCGFQAIQCFHVKAKIYEARIAGNRPLPASDALLREEFHVRN